MRLTFVLLLVFALLSGAGAFAQDEEASTPSEGDLLKTIEELGQGLIIQDGVTEEGQLCLLVINQNTQRVLWKVIYEDTDGNGIFSSGDNIVSLVNPAGKEIPVLHLVSPLWNRLRERIKERVQDQGENQNQGGAQDRERVQSHQRVQDRIQERTQNEGGTQTQEKVKNQERAKERPLMREKYSGSK